MNKILGRKTRGVGVHYATRNQQRRKQRTPSVGLSGSASLRRAGAPKKHHSFCILSRSSTELCVHDRKAVGALDVVHFGYAQHGGKNFRRNFHRAGLGRGAGLGLRKSGGRGGVEGHGAFDFFECLMCSAFADRWRTSVTLLGLIFISFEFVCCPDCARRRFIPGNKNVISGLNFSEVQASHFMAVFIRETFV